MVLRAGEGTRSCPNNSLSKRVSVSAVQSMTTKGCRGGLSVRIARAASSLPVPLSPVMSTVASAGATVSINSKTRFMAGLWPMICVCG